MYVQLPLLAILAGGALAASPDKPFATPKIPEDKLGGELEAFWKAPKSEKGYWLPGGLPEGCRSVALAKGYNPADFKTFNVKYSDCDQPWVFCRHKNAPASEAQMIETLGEIPVAARSFVRHFVAAPAFGTFTGGGITWSTGDILMVGNMGQEIMTHEVGHSMDWHALGYTFSQSATWQNAYAKDPKSITEYGRTSWAENFADSIMVAFYNHNIERGIGKIASNWKDFRYQKETAENYFGKFMNVGGKCSNRMANTKKVPFSTSAKMAAMPQDADTEVTWEGIGEIVMRPELEGLSTEDHSH